VALISQQNPPAKPRWPFENETANAMRNPSRHPGNFAGTLAVATLFPLAGHVLTQNPDFKIFTHLRGMIHSHLWTEAATSAAKVYFGRKRPFYDTVERRGEARRDDRLSFFSGHSSHAFALASYGSQLAFSELKDSPSAWLYATLLHGTATWIATSRAIDKQHNWSDVLAGAAVGSTIGYFTFQRVDNVSRSPLTVAFEPRRVSLQLKMELQ
jgi:membrane-associated phospholipid phosphatase